MEYRSDLVVMYVEKKAVVVVECDQVYLPVGGAVIWVAAGATKREDSASSPRSGGSGCIIVSRIIQVVHNFLWSKCAALTMAREHVEILDRGP